MKIVVTGDDDDNVITSMFAITSGCKKVITKIQESHIIRMLASDTLDSIVQPSSIATQRIVRYVRSMQNAYDSAIESLYYIFDRKVEILELKVSESFRYDGIPLKSLEVSRDAIVASIIRDGSCIIPTGDDVIHSGDSVIIATSLRGVLKLVGPTCNFSFFSIPTKLLLSLCMLMGRLELFPMLILLYPSTWKRRGQF